MKKVFGQPNWTAFELLYSNENKWCSFLKMLQTVVSLAVTTVDDSVLHLWHLSRGLFFKNGDLIEGGNLFCTLSPNYSYFSFTLCLYIDRQRHWFKNSKRRWYRAAETTGTESETKTEVCFSLIIGSAIIVFAFHCNCQRRTSLKMLNLPQSTQELKVFQKSDFSFLCLYRSDVIGDFLFFLYV